MTPLTPSTSNNLNMTPSTTNAPFPIPKVLKDIWPRIFAFLDVKDAVHCSISHHHFTYLLSDERLWDVLLNRDFPDSRKKHKLDIENPALLYQQLYKQKKKFISAFLQEKDLKNALFNNAFAKCRIQSLDNRGCLTTNMVLYGNKLIFGFHEKQEKGIEIYDIKTKETNTLRRDSLILHVKISEGNLIFGSMAGIEIYDLKTQKTLKTIKWQQDEIEKMVIGDDLCISGYRDGKVKIQNLETGQVLKEMKIETNSVRSMALWKNDILITGLNTGVIEFWDIQTGQMLESQHKCDHAVQAMAIWENKLFFGSGVKVRILDLETKQDFVLPGVGGAYILSLAIDDGKIIVETWDQNTCYDFNNPSLSPYSKQVIEENLKILGAMADAECKKQPEEVEKLAKQLHSDFQERLRQHSQKVGSSFSCCAKVISRVETEVCVERLLVAINDKDDPKVSQLIQQLIRIDPQNTKIWDCLLRIGGSPDSVDEWRWGEFAFHNQRGYSASASAKEKAVMEFKRILTDRWK